MPPSDARPYGPDTAIWGPATADRPVLTGTVHADLCVVGLGGSGLAAVQAGADAGLRVVGIDAAGVASGAAGRNGGFLLAGPAHFHHRARLQFGVDPAVALYRATVDEIDRFVAAGNSVRRTGSLRIPAADPERQDIEDHYQALVADGFSAERYEGVEGTGLRIPGDALFDPAVWARYRAARAIDSGALLFEQSPATAIESGLVASPRGTVRCEHVIVAVDGGLEVLVPELAGRVTTWRLQMLATEPVARRVAEHAAYCRYGLDYWQQLDDGRIVLGGGRDKGGDAERGAELGTTTAVQTFLESVLRERLGVEARVEHRWSGRVAFTEDSLPICEEVRPGVFVLGAYSGTGNVIGSICGREAVSKLQGGPAPFMETIRSIRGEGA